jgi:GT2 family glycosyltransferase
MPLVSVVIPTKNRPALVARAVATVLDQTVGDLEIIVVIDGEDPQTAARLAEVADPRLRVHTNATSLGSGKARNVGARLATGRWVAFLDDDDEWMPAKLERQLALPMPASGRVMLSCRSAYVTPHGTTIRPRELFDGAMAIDEWLFDRRRLFGGQSFIQTSSLMLPTALFQEVEFPGHTQHEDWEFVMLALKRFGVELKMAPEILVRHHAEEVRTSLSSSGQLDGSIAWAVKTRELMTPRAFSGFCLTTVAHQAARQGGWGNFLRPLKLAFAYGKPTAFQLLVFLMVWSVPRRLHQALRRLRPGSTRPPTEASTAAAASRQPG